MKILFTIRSLTGGGAERVVSVLSGLLADVGEDVHIITYKTSERDYSISEKVQIHEMPQRKDSTITCLLYTSPSPRDPKTSRMPSSA